MYRPHGIVSARGVTCDVLVIDDDADERDAVCGILRSAGLIAVGVEDGVRGLAWLRAANPSPRAVLLDLLMPEKDGWSLLFELRQDPALRGVPVILMTALAGQEFMLREAAVEGYLLKPFEFQELLAAVGGVLRRSRRLRSAT